ncbi:MAG: LapA family protein [Okeania sp. SIO2H7]|nr:LapA family protein [Okeania sp. SIO2H7]
MKVINFLLIFIICFAVVLFSLQNTELTTIKLIEGVQVQAPLSLELIMAMGIGAILAWFFSLWSRVQRTLLNWQSKREMRQREKRIQELEENIESYQTAAEEQQASLPPAEGTK